MYIFIFYISQSSPSSYELDLFDNYAVAEHFRVHQDPTSYAPDQNPSDDK